MQTACRTPCSRVAGDVGGRPNRIEHAKIRLRDETQGLRDRRRFSLRLAAKGKCRRSRCYRKLATRHAVSHHFSSDGSGSTGRSVARIRPCRRWQSDGITRRARLRFSRAHWRPARVPSPGPYDCHLVKLGRLGDDRVVQQDEDGSELDCPQRQAGNSHWRAFSYSGRGRPSSGYRETRVTPAAWMMPITLNRSQPNCRARTARHSFEAELIRRRNLSLSSGEVAHPSRCTNLATSMTTLECDPTPISLARSVARTANSICRPSTLVTSASPH